MNKWLPLQFDGPGSKKFVSVKNLSQFPTKLVTKQQNFEQYNNFPVGDARLGYSGRLPSEREAGTLCKTVRELVKITDEVANIKINSYSDSLKKMGIEMFGFFFAELWIFFSFATIYLAVWSSWKRIWNEIMTSFTFHEQTMALKRPSFDNIKALLADGIQLFCMGIAYRSFKPRVAYWALAPG